MPTGRIHIKLLLSLLSDCAHPTNKNTVNKKLPLACANLIYLQSPMVEDYSPDQLRHKRYRNNYDCQ